MFARSQSAQVLSLRYKVIRGENTSPLFFNSRRKQMTKEKKSKILKKEGTPPPKKKNYGWGRGGGGGEGITSHKKFFKLLP